MRNLERRVVRAFAGALSCAFIGASCSSASDFEKELDAIRSWTSTVELAASERNAGATTSAYTTRLFAEASDAMAQSRQTLMQAAHSDADSASAHAALDSLAASLRRHRAETVRP